jgi:hypothetical protein
VNLTASAAGLRRDQIAGDVHAAVQIGVSGIDGGIDDRYGDAAACRDLMRVLHLHGNGCRLQIRIRIVVLGGLCAEQIHSLHEIHARVGGERRDDLLRGTPRGHGEHFAISLERFDRPTVHSVEVVLAGELA